MSHDTPKSSKLVASEPVMLGSDETIELLFEYLKNVIYSPKKANLDIQIMPEAFTRLAQGMLYFGKSVAETRQLAGDIARGQLDTNPVSPGNELASEFKSLQSTLKHLTWQINHVAKGDYGQRVSFAGDFSDAINEMIEQLDERSTALNNELEVSHRKTEELRESNDLFEAITQGIAQWIVVVACEKREWLYTNRELNEVLFDLDDAPAMREWIVEQVVKYEENDDSDALWRTEEISFGDLIVASDVLLAKEGVNDGSLVGDCEGNNKTSSETIGEVTSKTTSKTFNKTTDVAYSTDDNELACPKGGACLASDDNASDKKESLGNQYFAVTRHPLTWHGEKALVFVLTDITEEKYRSMALETAAYYDTLTGTYSRLFGMNALDDLVHTKQQFILAFVDMDNLKYVNDTFGHKEGDAYILDVTQTLRTFDHKAIICRLGGDEFMVLAPGWVKGDADFKLEGIRDVLKNEIGKQYNRSISYGVVEVTPETNHSSSMILSMADELMYEYKRSRKMERRATMQ